MSKPLSIDAVAFDGLPFEVAVLDPDGLVLAASHALAGALAYEGGSCRGMRLAQLCGNQDEALRALNLALNNPNGDDVTCTFRGANGIALEMLLLPAPRARSTTRQLLMAVPPRAAAEALSHTQNGTCRRELEALADAVRELTCAATPEDLGHSILMGLDTVVGCDVGVVALYQSDEPGAAVGPAASPSPRTGPADASTGRIIQAYGLGPHDAETVLAIAEDRLQSYDGAQKIQPTVIPDVDAFFREHSRPDLGEALAAHGIRSVVHTALTVRGELIGTVLIGSSERFHYSTESAGLISAFAGQAACAAAGMLRSHPDERSAAFWQRILQVTLAINARHEIADILRLIVDAAADALYPACAEVWLLEEDRAQFQPPVHASSCGLRVADSLHPLVQRAAWETVTTNHAQSIAVSSEPAAAGDDASHGGAVIAVPLSTESEAFGVLIVELGDRASLSPRESSALDLLAAQAAVAISNLRLVAMADVRSHKLEAEAAQARDEEARARTLFTAATAITETTDLDTVLHQIAASAVREIGFERVRIYLMNPDEGRLEAKVEARSDGTIETHAPAEDLASFWEMPLSPSALKSTPYIIYSVAGETPSGSARYERLCVPLRTQAAVVGLMVAENPESCVSIEPPQTRLLQALAILAAVAIERARVDRMRSFLISSVSHELRAPLSSIQAYNELILDGDAGPVTEGQRVFLQRIDASCLRLRRVIDDLMDLSKLRAGEINIVFEPTDIHECVDQVVQTLKPRATEAQVDLIVDVADGLPLIQTDPLRYEQVLTNLVENATKYNYAGGSVRIRVWAESGGIVAAVTDTGPGIAESEQARIFGEFQRGADQLIRSREGAGLGLAIASRVAEYLGGNLSLESRAGYGSTFTFRVPMALAPQPESAPDTNEGT